MIEESNESLEAKLSCLGSIVSPVHVTCMRWAGQTCSSQAIGCQAFVWVWSDVGGGGVSSASSIKVFAQVHQFGPHLGPQQSAFFVCRMIVTDKNKNSVWENVKKNAAHEGKVSPIGFFV